MDKSPSMNIARLLVNGSSIPQIAPLTMICFPGSFLDLASNTEILSPSGFFVINPSGIVAFCEKSSEVLAVEFVWL